MVKEEKAFGIPSKFGRIITLEGSPSEVKKAFLSWAKRAFPEVQRQIKVRRVDLFGVKALMADLEAGERYGVQFKSGGNSFSSTGRTGFFLGAFHRLGDAVRLRAVVAQTSGYREYYRTAYGLLTRGETEIRGIPPEDLDLLVRAITRPEKAPLMEKLGQRRRNLRILDGLLPPHLGRPLAGAVCFDIDPKGLKVWDGVALYQDWHGRWLVFDRKAHRVEDSDWPLVQRILRRKRYTPLERARMAMVMVRLGK